MGTQPYEGKPAALPEAPQLSGIAEADGEIVIASGIGGDIGDHLPPEAFPLAGGMDSDPTDPQPAQRRRQGTAAVRRQRLGDQIPARPAKTRPYRPAQFARKSPLGHQPQGARYRAAGASAAESLARSIHHAPQIERGSSVMRPGQ